MNEEEKNINLKDLGEFGLIERLTKKIKLFNDNTLLGPGDDAAIINSSKEILVSSDMLVEGIHFDMAFTPLKHLGYKSVIVNISDIYAMNGIPKQITVGLAISSKYTLEAIEEFYDGILLACEKYKIDVIGGDITSCINGLTISITAIGEAMKNEIVKRSGAKENDLLITTGDLGGAYMGLNVLQREKEVWKSNPNMQPELDNFNYILERQLKPEARRDVIEFLKKCNVIPTSMIDMSDGLASEVFHICTSSNVGCQLYEEKIPIDPQTYQTSMDFNINPTVSALNGGEDYELLFTINQKDYEKIKNDPNLTVIGHITKKSQGINLIGNGDTSTPLQAQGWNHFNN
ncbi:MAG: Thiamine-monophosphate kinase [Crocinitomicaceae bacterium]|nr:MAG: Thiamine-monophosphate kinase [Crocinitomicaceae bacterium]